MQEHKIRFFIQLNKLLAQCSFYKSYMCLCLFIHWFQIETRSFWFSIFVPCTIVMREWEKRNYNKLVSQHQPSTHLRLLIIYMYVCMYALCIFFIRKGPLFKDTLHISGIFVGSVQLPKRNKKNTNNDLLYSRLAGSQM